MKVLHIIDSLGLGGAQTVVRGIFEVQKDNGNIFLYALRQREVTTEIGHPNVSIFPSKNKYSLAPLLKLKALIEREKIDILHCHLFRSNVFGFLLKKIWFPNIKLVVHEHGGIGVEGILYASSLYFIESKIDKLIAVAQHIKKSLIDCCIDSSKIQVIHNYVDLDKFNVNKITWDVSEERGVLGFSNNDYVVGYAGRIVKSKGWREFMEAAVSLVKKDKHIKFCIAGTGTESDELNLFVQSNMLNDQVVLLGKVTNMVWFYSLLDCFVLPSHREGMPMTQLEALAMKVPLISASSPGLTELIDQIKYPNTYFRTKDSLDLENKIVLYKTSPVDCGNPDLTNYSLSKYIDNLDNLYEQIT